MIDVKIKNTLIEIKKTEESLKILMTSLTKLRLEKFIMDPESKKILTEYGGII